MLIKEPLNATYIPNGLETPKQMTQRYLDFLENRDLLYPKNTVKHERLKLPNNLNHLKDLKERKLKRFRTLHSGGISKPKLSANIQISKEVQILNFALQSA